MKKILVIDSDVVFRRAVIRILQERGEYDIISSDDIENCVKLAEQIEPDLLLLSISLFKIEELALISVVRNRFPVLPLVIFTERSEEGAVVAISALQLGAVDFITKPASANSFLFSNNHLRKRLMPAVNASLRSRPARAHEEMTEQNSLFKNKGKIETGPGESNRRAELICVGGGTGGVSALLELIPGLPGDISVSIVVAQHFPGLYTRVLAEKLNLISDVHVREGRDGEQVLPGTVYVIPGGYHGEVDKYRHKTTLKLHRGPRQHGNRPSIDHTFRSAAYAYGLNSLGIILSGNGYDGVAGARMVRDSGGQILVQSPRSSLCYELPMAVLKNGYANGCYPVREMSRQLTGRISERAYKGSIQEMPKSYTTDYRTSKRQDKLLFGLS